VVISGHGFLRQVAVLDRLLQHHPLAQLSHVVPVHLLPRRLALWDGVSTLSFELLPPSSQLLGGKEDVGGALVEVNANLVAVPEEGEVAARRGLGTRVEDRRTSRRTALTTVTDTRQDVDAPFEEMSWRATVYLFHGGRM
jgi:hypothetical protein